MAMCESTPTDASQSSPNANSSEFRCKVARTGFDQAVVRYEAQVAMGDNVDALSLLVPLAEALWWAISLDEEYDGLEVNYRATRNADETGRLLLGLRYARNRCGHQRALSTYA